MTKYILELTQEQADIISIATDLYCRIRLGQFDRIIDHTLEERIDEIGIDDFLQRREEAEKYFLNARTICFPELENTFQQSYGLAHDKKSQVAWNVHQVLRYHAGNDERKPYAIWGELPKIKKVEDCEDNGQREIIMDICEANRNLMLIGNAMIIERCNVFYVVPRTTTTVQEADWADYMLTVDEAYMYAKKLPSDWKMYG